VRSQGVHRPPPSRSSDRDTILGLSPRTYLTALAAIVIVVVALASFIVWALLSGTSSFGSNPDQDPGQPRGGMFIATGSGAQPAGSAPRLMVPPSNCQYLWIGVFQATSVPVC
jgi:hypothetical protein